VQGLPVEYRRYIGSDVFGDVLPTAHIESAKVAESGGSVKIKVFLSVYELRTSEADSLWYTNEDMRGFMHINIAANSKAEIVETVTRTIDAFKQDDLSKYAFDMMPNGDIIYKIPYEVEIEIENSSLVDMSLLALSAYFEIDTTEFEQQYGVSYTLPISVGVIKRKVVLRNGRLKKEQTAYFLNNKVWLGSVHNHEGIVKAGSRHVEGVSHPDLTPKQVSNCVTIDSLTTKVQVETIVDLQMNDQLAELLQTGQETNRSSYSSLISEKAFVSNQYLSKGSDNSFSTFFSIDIESFVVQNSEYGFIYAFLSLPKRRSLLNKAAISYIEVQRQRTDIQTTYAMGNPFSPVSVVVSKDKVARTFLQSDELKEINLNGGYVRTFKLKDSEISQNPVGEYHYKLFLKIYDPIYDFFQQLYEKMTNMVDQLTVYHSNSTLTSNYDYDRDMFRPGYIKQIRIGTKYWKKASQMLESFLKTFNLNVSSDKIRQIIDNVELYLEPSTATLQSIEATIEIFDSMLSNMRNFVNTKDFDAINESRPKSSTLGATNLIELEHDFEGFDVSSYNSYLQFMDLDGLGISSTDYTSQYNDDIARYVTEESSAKVTSAQYSFFSLNRIQVANSSFNMYSWDDDILEELMALNNFPKGTSSPSLESGFTSLEASELLMQRGISILDVSPEYQSSAVTNPQGTPMSDIVGTKSPANPQTTALSKQPSKFFASIQGDVSSINRSLATLLPFDSEDISISEQELIEDVGGRKGRKSTQSYSLYSALVNVSAPRHVSATPRTNYNSNSLAYDINSNDANINTQLNKFITLLKYGTMARIEYLTDATYSSGGVKDPIWSRLTSEVLSSTTPGRNILCRVVRITSSGYPSKSSELFDYKILGEYFVLNIAAQSAISADTGTEEASDLTSALERQRAGSIIGTRGQAMDTGESTSTATDLTSALERQRAGSIIGTRGQATDRASPTGRNRGASRTDTITPPSTPSKY
tara:strand:- start:5704 stop:8652 length:2949 start_codon:yes stop_codon:yes gene_type:complete